MLNITTFCSPVSFPVYAVYVFRCKSLKEYSTERKMREYNWLENMNFYFQRKLILKRYEERIVLAIMLETEFKWFSKIRFESFCTPR